MLSLTLVHERTEAKVIITDATRLEREVAPGCRTMVADAEASAAKAAAATSAGEPNPEAAADAGAAGAAGGDADFIAAASFDGPREGFTFSTRDGRTGYFRDDGPSVAKGVSFGADEAQEYELSEEERLAKQMEAMEFLDFVVPDGATPGTKLNLALPSGRMAEWYVPEGIEGGTQCRLPLPADEMGLTAMTRGVGEQADAQAAEDEDAGAELRRENERKREERYLAMKREKELSGGHAVGDMVKTWQGELGTIRYIGMLEGKGEKVWLGIEWAKLGRGKNDGSVGEKRYFTCGEGMGSFVDVKKQAKILDSRYNQYTDAILASVIKAGSSTMR